jgi:glycosyltransferase involved in cell wall biosynthesis
MQISVVIPVYNAEQFLDKAVKSALSQAEVHEVVLVEDNSPDNSLQVCKLLEKQNSKVRVVRHPKGENLGAAETRNLGIRSAVFDYIAFLDADDYYLPGRFEVANKLFQKHENIDGVYEAIGMHYYSEEAKNVWLSKSGEKLTTLSNGVQPNELFEKLLKGEDGYLHLDGLVLKKRIFKTSGYFLTNLRLHQDTAIFLQLAAVGKLIPGRLDVPVANRGIHDENRILSNYDHLKTRYMLWQSLFSWSVNKNLHKTRKISLFKRYIISLMRLIRGNKGLLNRFQYLIKLTYACMMHPILATHVVYDEFSKKLG